MDRDSSLTPGEQPSVLAPLTAPHLVLPSLSSSIGRLRARWAATSVILHLVVTAVLVTDTRSTLRAGRTEKDDRQGTRWTDAAGTPGLAPVALSIRVRTLWLGTGGFGIQNEDYLVGNSPLKALSVRPWPVTMVLAGAVTPVVDYSGCCLPAAIVGKRMRWAIANAFLFLWTDGSTRAAGFRPTLNAAVWPRPGRRPVDIGDLR